MAQPIPGAGKHRVVGALEYRVVQERFELSKKAFAAVRAAHQRGEFNGPEQEELLRAVSAVREAVERFRQAHLEA